MASKKLIFGLSPAMLVGIGLGAYFLFRGSKAQAQPGGGGNGGSGPIGRLELMAGDEVLGERKISNRDVVYYLHTDGWWYEQGSGTAGYDSPDARQAFPNLMELLTEIIVYRITSPARDGITVWRDNMDAGLLHTAVLV